MALFLRETCHENNPQQDHRLLLFLLGQALPFTQQALFSQGRLQAHTGAWHMLQALLSSHLCYFVHEFTQPGMGTEQFKLQCFFACRLSH